MFWGLPVRVAVELTFEAVASATRYGSGLRLSWSVSSIKNGANIRQTVSLRNSAASQPMIKISSTRNTRGERAIRTMNWPARTKKPDSFRLALMIIILNSRISVSKSK